MLDRMYRSLWTTPARILRLVYILFSSTFDVRVKDGPFTTEALWFSGSYTAFSGP